LAAAPSGLECDEVVRGLRSSADLSEQSERRLLEIICRFLRYLDSAGIGSLTEVSPATVRDFVVARSAASGAKPSVATSHLRRSAIRLLFRSLRQAEVVAHDPTMDLALPPRSSLAARPLTDDEVALGRSFSLKSMTETRRPAAWALAEATARTAEIASARVGDLDLGSGQVWLAGGTKVEPRWARLTPWGVQALERRLDGVGTDPDMLLVYEGAGSPAPS
jgi:integrase/recombinase XerC